MTLILRGSTPSRTLCSTLPLGCIRKVSLTVSVSRSALISPLPSSDLTLTCILQSHFILNEVPQDLQTNMERFTSVGLEVAVTELDIRITLPATEEDLQNQATQYAQVVQACVNVKKCVGVVSVSFLLVQRVENGPI